MCLCVCVWCVCVCLCVCACVCAIKCYNKGDDQFFTHSSLCFFLNVVRTTCYTGGPFLQVGLVFFDLGSIEGVTGVRLRLSTFLMSSGVLVRYFCTTEVMSTFLMSSGVSVRFISLSSEVLVDTILAIQTLKQEKGKLRRQAPHDSGKRSHLVLVTSYLPTYLPA